MLLGHLPLLRALGIRFVIVMIATGCPIIKLRKLFAVRITEQLNLTNANMVRTLHIQSVFQQLVTVLIGTTAIGGKTARAQAQQEPILVAGVSSL